MSLRYFYFTDEEGNELEVLMRKGDLDQYLLDNPNLQRVLKMPQINTVNSATFVDGHIPESRKQALDIEKKILKAKATLYDTKPADREYIQKEIKNLEGSRKAPIGVNKGGKDS